MELAVERAGGAGSVEVADTAFNVPFKQALIHQVVTAYMAGGRSGTKAQKSRAEVSGGGKKPWRQKGTGRARAGSSRSPIWRGGGVTFAARPVDHSQKVNKKMYRGAMRSMLSELNRQGRLVVIDDLVLEAPKTRDLLGRLKALEAPDALVVVAEDNENLRLAARNVHSVDVTTAAGVDPVSLVGFEKVVITLPALKRLEERLA